MNEGPAMTEPNQLYETETMAELCARQGRPGEAIAIYRRLCESHPGSDHRPRWQGRLEALEREREVGRADVEVVPADLPLPAPPGVAIVANDDGVTVAWSLFPGTPEPTLELFLIQRTPTGVETGKRTVPLAAIAGRIAFAVPALHSALAAVGRREDDRFVPIARCRS
jgi:hypothetical protein